MLRKPVAPYVHESAVVPISEEAKRGNGVDIFLRRFSGLIHLEAGCTAFTFRRPGRAET